ncbi:MAG: transporter substrate-binding domain-containing protein [Clostridia bacterium]
MSKKVLALVLAALVAVMGFIFVACSSDAEEDTTTMTDLEYIIDKGTLVVGITDYAPMNYLDDDGEWTGFDTEFALLVGEALGVEVEFIEINWDNKFIELSGKSIDAIWNGMTITDEVLLNASVSDAYVVNAQVVVMSSDVVGDYTDTESMMDLTFAVEAGSAGESEAATAGFENVTAVAAQSDALLEVQSGAADACIIDITMANAMTGEGTSYADLAYAVELSVEEYGIAVRTDSDLVDEINSIMADLIADGSLVDLAEKYELTLAE